MKQLFLISLIFFLLVGCVELSQPNERFTKRLVSVSPFFHVSYANNSDFGEVYAKLKEDGFSGCKVKPRLNKIGKIGRLTFEKDDNCSANEIILSKDRDRIKNWLAEVLVENSDITGLTNRNVEMQIVRDYRSGGFDIEIGPQIIDGYRVVQRGGYTPHISAVIRLNEYNNTRYNFFIRGSYYPEPNVTVKSNLTLEQAKYFFITGYNKQMEESCKNKQNYNSISEIAPQPRCNLLNESIFLTNSEEVVGINGVANKLRVIVSENDELERIEYRLVWNIKLKQNCQTDADIDAVTGELIAVNDHCIY